MNTEDKFIQDLFSQKLQNAEAPVDPAIWEGISNALPASGTAAGASASAGFQMGALGWVATGLVAAAIAVSAFVFQAPEETTSAEIAEVEPTFHEEPAALAEEVIEPTETPEESTEQSVQKEQQPVQMEQPTVEPTTANEDNATQNNDASQGSEKPRPEVNDENPGPATSSEKTKEQQPEKPEAKQPNPALSADFEIVEAPFTELTFEFRPAFVGATAYFWNFGDGTTSQEMQPSHLFLDEGVYSVVLVSTDENGFEKVFEQELNVVLPSLLVLPNTFTPDNNGTNDFLLPAVHLKNVEIQKMMVFSTKGELLFEQDGNGSGWDGNLADGSPAPKGDYVLIVKAISPSGENITKQRKVLLQRN